MASIQLEEMNAIRLMNRIDTKFITTAGRLTDVLRDAAGRGYRVCEIDGQRILGYRSLYYDTPRLEMYTLHRNGHKVRQKIRVRTYLVSGLTFLEIKRKNNKGRTSKKRMEIPQDCFEDIRRCPEAGPYIAKHSAYAIEDITPACTTEFQRITLVNAAKTERLTIDFDLAFSNRRTGRTAAKPGLVVIELKQDGRIASEMKGILLNHRIKAFRISKYCIGTILTDPQVRQGRFKEKIRYIDKLTLPNPVKP
ncbi:MAG: polyphosphate polymerase domain-containing protein [Bacteroidales bacterium]|nr:polyphosphate polymerase domain-containing protein [Bacteroidales bacterium]